MTRASLILFWFALTISVSVALYNTSYGVHELNQRMHEITTQIENEQAALHVLKTEWVYLSSPARIEKQARKHLSLRPTAIKQIAKLEDLSVLLPTREEVVAGVQPATPSAQKIAVRSNEDPKHVNTRMVFRRNAEAKSSPVNKRVVLANSESR